ncbi:hypothetical protein glysoja_006926 [Glycine soja]|nr:hypothetical protein glysoja_006926 [Glycine soja]
MLTFGFQLVSGVALFMQMHCITQKWFGQIKLQVALHNTKLVLAYIPLCWDV